MSILGSFLGLLRLFFVVALLAVLWRALRQWFFGRPPAAEPDPSKSSRSPVIGRTVRDPICGMYVATELAISGPSGLPAVYFCSEACKQKYLSLKS